MDHKFCKDCKGFCCDDIGIFISPRELQNSYHRFVSRDIDKKEKEQMVMSVNNSQVTLWNYIWLTYPMLVFSHQDYIHPDGDIDVKSEDRIVYHYSCKHHNKKTKDCDIYEERPMMCRSFPNNDYCGYRKVRDKRVISFRPKWFKFGMTYHDWYYKTYPDKKPKKDKPNDSCPTEVKAEETDNGKA